MHDKLTQIYHQITESVILTVWFSLFCEQIIQTVCAKWIKYFTEHTNMSHWKPSLDCHMTLEDKHIP